MREILLFSFFIVVSGCKKDTSYLETELFEIKQKMGKLEDEIKFEKFMNSFDKSAIIKVGSEGYSLVRGDIGTLTVSMKNVTSYANGVKVYVEFGNTTSANIDGLNFEISYGSLNPDNTPNYTDSRTKKIELPKDIRPGAWNGIPIILENIAINQFGFLEISEIRHKGIKLRR